MSPAEIVGAARPALTAEAGEIASRVDSLERTTRRALLKFACELGEPAPSAPSRRRAR